ncbi:uncharacterized protein PRCAT00001429001 [Priceomyces carsonii]|uniref:uncharacterized protein n=1 Tax=Priceomyces carsonii TaxID=28549 RepID=UPI002ED77858|nr:unnamed protein product [Priceomyces carsonii]
MARDIKFNYGTTKDVIEVSNLGTVTGIKFPELCVTQFLGVPFAEIPGRFRKSILLDTWANKSCDATNFGPYCHQVERSFYPIPLYERPWSKIPIKSEHDVLNLNITCPCNVNEEVNLPVMVFIHGGANTYAAGSASMYDGLHLAKLSQDLKQPTIIVTINYRVGAAGFLASHDLKKYNEKFGESGVGNYGVWDQINALRWINKYIHSFGGDANRITVFGQSAGSQATHMAILRDEKLFSRAILQSGLSPLCGIFSIDQYDRVYFKLLEKLGIDTTLTPEKRVEALLGVDGAELAQANEDIFDIQVVTMAYTDDREVLPNNAKIPSWSNLDKPISSSIEAVMIGDCKNECIIWNDAYKSYSAEEFIQILKSKCSTDDIAATFIDLYKIHPGLTKSETFNRIEMFTSDGMYLLPNYIFCLANGNAFRYHFDEPSTYNNEWCGYAHHSLDNVYIWGMLKDSLEGPQRVLSEHMSRVWLDFANGKTVWESYKENGKSMVFGPEGKCGLVSDFDDDKRNSRYPIWRKIVELDLVQEFGRVCEDICLLRSKDHGYI